MDIVYVRARVCVNVCTFKRNYIQVRTGAGGDVYAPDNMRVIRIVDEVEINNAVRPGKVAGGGEIYS